MRCPGQLGRGKASDASNLVGRGRAAGNRARPLTRSHPAAPSPARGRGCARSSSARDSFSSRRGRGLHRSSGRACGSYRLQKSTSGVWRQRRTGDESVAVSRLAGLLSKAGERASEAGSRRQSLEIGGGLRAAKAGRGTRRWKAPGASCPGAIVDAIGPGRGSAGSSGFGWKGSCLGRQRWDRLLVSRKKTPRSRWRCSEGSLDRQPAKDRVALAGHVLNVPNRVPLPHRSSVCAVKRPPTRAAACLNRTRRRESIDTLVLVAKRRLSEFGKDASFSLVTEPQGSKAGVDSTARQAHIANGRRGLHRVGRQGCATSPT